MKKLLLVPILFLGCGIKIKHEVSGEATVHVKVELDPKDVLSAYENLCTQEQAPDVNACVDKNLGDYFRSTVDELNKNGTISTIIPGGSIL